MGYQRGNRMGDNQENMRKDIYTEYNRWKQILLTNGDPYVDRFAVGLSEVLQAHFLLIDHFFRLGEGIGGVGPKSEDLLHSALGRQYSSFDGRVKWADRIDVCATLMYGLIKNHPFHDANKRTAFLVSLLHLQKIGRTPRVAAERFEDFTVLVADNQLSTNADDDVRLISNFLKQNTREIDLRVRLRTYKEVNSLISRFGLDLRNPKGNRIDLVRTTDNDTGEFLSNPSRIARVGFHGWTKEISRTDLHIIRNAARLDPQHGIDSQSFFYGIDGPLDMIKKYEEPLRRLAYR